MRLLLTTLEPSAGLLHDGIDSTCMYALDYCMMVWTVWHVCTGWPEAAAQTCAQRSESEICCSRTSASRHMLQPSPSNAMLFISTNVLSFTRTRRTDGEENDFENLCRWWSLVLQHVIDCEITMKIWCTMLQLARQFNKLVDTDDSSDDTQRSTNLKLFYWFSISMSLSYQDFISVNKKFI